MTSPTKNFGVPASLFGHTPDPSEAIYISSTRFQRPLSSDANRGHDDFAPQNFSHRVMAQTPIKTKSGSVWITDPASSCGNDHRPQHWWRCNRAECANFTGIRTPTSGNITSKGRPAWECSRVRPSQNVRFSCWRCRLCALRHGAIHIENTGNTPLRFLEIFKKAAIIADLFRSIPGWH